MLKVKAPISEIVGLQVSKCAHVCVHRVGRKRGGEGKGKREEPWGEEESLLMIEEESRYLTSW